MDLWHWMLSRNSRRKIQSGECHFTTGRIRCFDQAVCPRNVSKHDATFELRFKNTELRLQNLVLYAKVFNGRIPSINETKTKYHETSFIQYRTFYYSAVSSISLFLGSGSYGKPYRIFVFHIQFIFFEYIQKVFVFRYI